MIDGLRVLAIIPARGGSKGLPGKNILPVQGKPLIAWTVEAARAARTVDRIVVSSDDAAIIAAALAAGAEAPFVRDSSLATDEARSVDVVLDVMARVPGFDLMVLLQPTSPLRTTDDIDGAVERLVATGAPTCVSVRPAEEHPYWTFTVDGRGALQRFCQPLGGVPSRRQELPEAWCLNGAVYVLRTPWFLTHKTFISDETVAFPMPAERSLDIDTPDDIDELRRRLVSR
jgi:N-acylneuraminate cytidylyltransferase